MQAGEWAGQKAGRWAHGRSRKRAGRLASVRAGRKAGMQREMQLAVRRGILMLLSSRPLRFKFRVGTVSFLWPSNSLLPSQDGKCNTDALVAEVILGGT